MDGRGPLEFNTRLRAYTTARLPSNSFDVRVEGAGLEGQGRRVTVDDRALPVTFVLGKPGLPHYYRGPVKVPYELPSMVALSLKPEVDTLSPSLIQHVRALALEEDHQVPVHAVPQRVRVFRAPPDRSGNAIAFEREVLKADMIGKDVQRVGQVVRYDAESLSFLTNECVVKFRPGFDGQLEVGRRGLEVLRSLPYNDAVVVQASPRMTSTELLEICNEWAENGMAIWAEPNLVSTVVPHAPNDPHLTEQTHHSIVGSQGAWDVFQTAKTTNRSAKCSSLSPTWIFATHEDLKEILRDPFNFSKNSQELLEHPHGTKVAGMIGAVVNNGRA